MIYEKIKNLQEIVGKEAHSLSWPLGGKGKERKEYFLSKDFIKGHIHCQPFSEDGSFAGIKEGICDCFLIRKKEKLKKDEIETADLFSYQLPDFYGQKISEVYEVDWAGIKPIINNSFKGNRRFVILWKNNGKIEAMVPKKIGKIPTRYKEKDGISITQGDTLFHYFNYCIPKLKEEKNIKPIGLWFTNSSLEKTPSINIEDSWDTAMMTYYHPKLTEKEEAPGFEELPKQMRPGFIKTYSLEERRKRARNIFEDELIVTSRRFADIAKGNFLVAYNLHDYLVSKKGKLETKGLDSTTTESFGGPEKFLGMFVSLVEKQFSNVKVGFDNNIPVILASDKTIRLKP